MKQHSDMQTWAVQQCKQPFLTPTGMITAAQRLSSGVPLRFNTCTWHTEAFEFSHSYLHCYMQKQMGVLCRQHSPLRAARLQQGQR
jgi:hypothetical protein